MSKRDRRGDAATMTVGLAGTAGAGAMRHKALARSYRESSLHPLPRPKLLAERRFVKHPKGRMTYLAGAGLAAASLPAAAVGTNRTFRKSQPEKESFLRVGMRGARESIIDRTNTVKQKPPPSLVAGNYLAGGLVGSAAGGVVNTALKRRRFPGTARAALASSAGVLAGAATLPVQSKVTQRATKGKYVMTPTGVRRAKTKPARPSSKASVYDGRGGNAARFRAQTEVGKAAPQGWLVPTAIAKASDDPGANMSRMERRARVTAASPPIPVWGDLLQARTASKYAAKPYRRRAAVENFAGGTAGQAAGMAAGTGVALGAASRWKGFDRRAQAANDRIEGLKTNVRTRAGLKPAGQSMTSRVINSPKTPARAKSAVGRIAASPAGRAVARNPKVAAVGALVGGSIGGTAAQQATYGRIMTRDDRYRRAQLKKADTKPLNRQEREGLRRKKNQSAALSYFTGGAGLSALAATAGAAALKRPRVRRAATRVRLNPNRVERNLKAVQVPLLTAGAGVGGYNSLNYAAIQRREAGSVGKSLRLRPSYPRPRVLSTRRRAPSMRRGSIRQTRYPSGMIRVSTVRGGLS